MWECFREALNPEIQKSYIGYCNRAEAPFWVMIPMEDADSEKCPICGAARVAEPAGAKGGKP
jgi:hypothetical protein